MQFQMVPYLWLSLAVLIVLTAIFISSWKGRHTAGVKLLLLSLLLGSALVIGQAMEIGCVELSDKLFWANIQYTVISFLPITYFYMTLCYVESWQWMKKRWLQVALLLLGLFTMLLFWTNDSHGLLLKQVFIRSNGTLTVLGKAYGPLFGLIVAIYSLLCLLTLAVLVRGSIKRTTYVKAQTLALLLGLLIPLCSLFLHYAGVLPLVVDPTTLTIGISGLIIFWVILRHRLFDIVKIAYSMIIEELTEGLIIVDSEGIVLEITPAARSMLGLIGPKTGLRYPDLLSPYPRLLAFFESHSSAREELQLETGEGTKYLEVSLTPLQKSRGKILGCMLQLYDITARKQQEDQIIQAASLDPLTGLLNRRDFHKRLSDYLEYAKASGTTFAVAYVDLDDFKPINDTYGHWVGDACLREAAARLRGNLREMDVITRYGGDEFVILLPSPGDLEAIRRLGEKMIHAFDERFVYGEHSFQIKASIGISVYPDDGEDPEALIAKADKAMYAVKTTRKNGILMYQES